MIHLNVTGGLDRKEVLEYLALLESTSSHPIAAAILRAARDEGVSIPKHKHVQDHRVLEGEGLTAKVDGVRVHVGNLKLLHRLGLAGSLPAKHQTSMTDWGTEGGTVGFVGIEGHGIVAVYCVADAMRAEAEVVLASLRAMGISATMLTGDSSDAAHSVGRRVGLAPSEIRSQLLPADKLEIVEERTTRDAQSALSLLCCRRNNLVLMCGDGVNDAPALATADVGVAMGAGAALATETSDVTLMDSNLKKLLYCLEMGRRVNRTIGENVVFSLVVKALVLGFTFAGKSTLWVAIASDVGAMLIVTLNGMKLLPSKKNKFRVRNDKTDEEELSASLIQKGRSDFPDYGGCAK